MTAATHAAIVGWAHTPFGRHDAETVESLIVRAANEALAHAGLDAADVDVHTPRRRAVRIEIEHGRSRRSARGALRKRRVSRLLLVPEPLGRDVGPVLSRSRREGDLDRQQHIRRVRRAFTHDLDVAVLFVHPHGEGFEPFEHGCVAEKNRRAGEQAVRKVDKDAPVAVRRRDLEHVA